MYYDTFTQFPCRCPTKMLPKLILTTLVLCAAVVVISGERSYCKNCYFIPNRRMKRGKYYSNPPQRFYSRPPVNFPYIGVYSNTPPPNYIAEDDSPYPGPPGSRPYKVSRRPTEGLGDEDINNLMKYLTKHDLDKIVDFANGQKQNRPDNEFGKQDTKLSIYKVQSENEILGKNYENEERKQEANNLFKANVQYVNAEATTSNPNNDQITYKYTDIVNYVTETSHDYFKEVYNFNPSESEPRIVNKQISYDTKDTDQYNPNNNDPSSFTEEDYMPKPLNLREEPDFYGDFTNNVPKVVPSDTSMYKVESFGELPLMNYNSKLDSVSSYHVPHYTVTTSSKQADSSSLSSSAKVPAVEPAPPISAGKEQSDAHLKATKIWSHKSKGAAYYLHDDGTLSLEKPGPPKRSYSFS